MENTGKVFFENDQPQWYVAMGERWIGPLAATDVYQKVIAQEISWAHFVWRAGQAEWRRLCDVPTFQAAVPAAPASGVRQAVKEASQPEIRKAAAPAARKAAEPRSWFLYYSDSQFGPFSTEEVSRFLRVGKIHGRVHAWKDGMTDWSRLEELELFREDVAEAQRVREERKKASAGAGKAPSPPSGPSSRQDQRSAPRRPLVAKIMMANQESVIVAVCRDISVGGMQVLTDRVPGKTGDRIRMNVSPAGSGDAIEAFVAEGVIVRILEDGRGFSFRFDRLPDASRGAIEKYIQSAG